MSSLLQVTVSRSAEPAARLLAVGCFEDEPPAPPQLSEPLRRAISRGAREADWSGRADGELHLPGTGDVGTIELFGLGKTDELQRSGVDGWLDRVLASTRAGGWRSLALAFPSHPELDGAGGALRLQLRLALSGYRFDRFLERSERPTLRTARLLPPAGATAAHRRARRLQRPIAAGVVLARDLANSPPNLATPAWIASRARAVARSRGIKASVLTPKELRRRGMRALLAVGRGSRNTPRLVRLRWGERGPAIALVGKGVTFDTGGISLKPGKAMDEMKYDKSGACTVLGACQAIADLDLPVRLDAYLPLAENMPDGAAYRPGDIVRCYNGKSVEIINTDAEGRLILADAMAWAAEGKPDVLVEVSTLTGATVVALGYHGAALYTPDDTLAEELLQASGASGERLWRMPLWPEFLESMKGNHADLRNLGGRWGGANAAAAFLSQFVGDLSSWAHLDIAGTAWVGSDQEGSAGGTGYGVALLAEWLARRTGR